MGHPKTYLLNVDTSDNLVSYLLIRKIDTIHDKVVIPFRSIELIPSCHKNTPGIWIIFY